MNFLKNLWASAAGYRTYAGAIGAIVGSSGVAIGGLAGMYQKFTACTDAACRVIYMQNLPADTSFLAFSGACGAIGLAVAHMGMRSALDQNATDSAQQTVQILNSQTPIKPS